MERTSQLNVGGNMDFYNMLERERLDSKKISKTNAVTSIMGHELPEDDVHVGPSDYVAWLTDRKWAHIRLEGRSFGDVPLNVELKLEVWDSPNSAGVVIDAVRIIKLALNNGIAGQLDGPSSYLMKSPHSQRPDDEAREQTEEFIATHAAQEHPGGRRLEAERSEEGQVLRRSGYLVAPEVGSTRRDRPTRAAEARGGQDGESAMDGAGRDRGAAGAGVAGWSRGLVRAGSLDLRLPSHLAGLRGCPG